MRRVLGLMVFFVLFCLFFSLGSVLPSQAQSGDSEQAQIVPPVIRRAEPPSPNLSAEDLDKKGDELRGMKYYLDAMDYYQAAFKKKPNSAPLLNKMGITQLSLHHYPEAKKFFEHAVKADRNMANAYNNLGVVLYVDRKFGKAIKLYTKAIEISPESASYYSNLGAAYFSEKKFEKAIEAYSKAVSLDPEVFERSSRSGISAQMSRPEDRAHYEYVMAKLYAKMGESDRALQSLRKAMEEGYKDIGNVYKDSEFGELRKDPRFMALMAAKPVGIPD